MESGIDLIIYSAVCGCIATLVMDVWAIIQKRVWAVPPLNYCLVGRWFLHMKNGQVVHMNITQSKEQHLECHVGWFSHYLVGVLFAGLYIALNAVLPVGTSFIAVVGFGLLTVVVPFFIMQPCFGFGFLASKAPSPWMARFRSCVAHLSFGVGLYVSFQLVSAAKLLNA